MISTAPSACEAPVIMLRRNSAWPGASISTMSRELVGKRIWGVSMVMPWSRSVCSASRRNDHSNGMPRRALTAFSISNLPSGRLPVSCNRRTTSVDLPWSTWPTMTMRTCGRVVPFGVDDMVAGTIMFMGCTPLECRSEIARDAQPFERVFGFMVERSPRALRYFGLLELDQDLLDRGRVRDDGEGDVGIAERAVALAVVGKIER